MPWTQSIDDPSRTTRGPRLALLGRQPALPDVRWLDDVVVERDDERNVGHGAPWSPE